MTVENAFWTKIGQRTVHGYGNAFWTKSDLIRHYTSLLGPPFGGAPRLVTYYIDSNDFSVKYKHLILLSIYYRKIVILFLILLEIYLFFFLKNFFFTLKVYLIYNNL